MKYIQILLLSIIMCKNPAPNDNAITTPITRYVTKKIYSNTYIVQDTIDIIIFTDKRYGKALNSYSLYQKILDIQSLDTTTVKISNNLLFIQKKHNFNLIIKTYARYDTIIGFFDNSNSLLLLKRYL